MFKEIQDILDRVGDSAEFFGFDKEELISLIIIAKFKTGFEDAALGNILKTLFTKVSREGFQPELLEKTGISIEGNDIYEALDKIADYIDKADTNQQIVISDLLGSNLVKELVSKLFGTNKEL